MRKKKKKYNAYIIVCLICSYYSLPKTTVICTTRKQSLKLIWSAGDHVLNIRVKQQACSATWSGGVSILTVNILDQRLLSMWSRGHFCNDHYYPTEPKSGAKLVWTPSCTDRDYSVEPAKTGDLMVWRRFCTDRDYSEPKLTWSEDVSMLTVTILLNQRLVPTWSGHASILTVTTLLNQRLVPTWSGDASMLTLTILLNQKWVPTWPGGIPVLGADPAAGPGILGVIAGVGIYQVLAVLVAIAEFTA